MILVHKGICSHSSTPFHAAVPSVSRSLGGVRARVRGRSRRPAGCRTRALARVRDREKSSRSVGVLEREREDEGAFFQCLLGRVCSGANDDDDGDDGS